MANVQRDMTKEADISGASLSPPILEILKYALCRKYPIRRSPRLAHLDDAHRDHPSVIESLGKSENVHGNVNVLSGGLRRQFRTRGSLPSGTTLKSLFLQPCQRECFNLEEYFPCLSRPRCNLSHNHSRRRNDAHHDVLANFLCGTPNGCNRSPRRKLPASVDKSSIKRQR